MSFVPIKKAWSGSRQNVVGGLSSKSRCGARKQSDLAFCTEVHYHVEILEVVSVVLYNSVVPTRPQRPFLQKRTE